MRINVFFFHESVQINEILLLPVGFSDFCDADCAGLFSDQEIERFSQ